MLYEFDLYAPKADFHNRPHERYVVLTAYKAHAHFAEGSVRKIGDS
jgi:hypothetical protein